MSQPQERPGYGSEAKRGDLPLSEATFMRFRKRPLGDGWPSQGDGGECAVPSPQGSHEIWEDREITLSLLSGPEHNLEERILKEQFVP